MKYPDISTGIALSLLMLVSTMWSASSSSADALPKGFKDILLGQSESEFLRKYPNVIKYPTDDTPQSQRDSLKKEFGYDAMYEVENSFHMDGDDYSITASVSNGTIINTTIVLINSDSLDRCLRRFDRIRAELESKYGAFPQNAVRVESRSRFAAKNYPDRNMVVAATHMSGRCNVIVSYKLKAQENDPL